DRHLARFAAMQTTPAPDCDGFASHITPTPYSIGQTVCGRVAALEARSILARRTPLASWWRRRSIEHLIDPRTDQLIERQIGGRQQPGILTIVAIEQQQWARAQQRQHPRKLLGADADRALGTGHALMIEQVRPRADWLRQNDQRR